MGWRPSLRFCNTRATCQSLPGALLQSKQCTAEAAARRACSVAGHSFPETLPHELLLGAVVVPPLLEMLAQVQLQTQLKQPPLLAATRPAVPVAWGGPRWPLPAAPLEVAALVEALILAVAAS